MAAHGRGTVDQLIEAERHVDRILTKVREARTQQLGDRPTGQQQATLQTDDQLVGELQMALLAERRRGAQLQEAMHRLAEDTQRATQQLNNQLAAQADAAALTRARLEHEIEVLHGEVEREHGQEKVVQLKAVTDAAMAAQAEADLRRKIERGKGKRNNMAKGLANLVAVCEELQAEKSSAVEAKQAVESHLMQVQVETETMRVQVQAAQRLHQAVAAKEDALLQEQRELLDGVMVRAVKAETEVVRLRAQLTEATSEKQAAVEAAQREQDEALQAALLQHAQQEDVLQAAHRASLERIQDEQAKDTDATVTIAALQERIIQLEQQLEVGRYEMATLENDLWLGGKEVILLHTELERQQAEHANLQCSLAETVAHAEESRKVAVEEAVKSIKAESAAEKAARMARLEQEHLDAEIPSFWVSDKDKLEGAQALNRFHRERVLEQDEELQRLKGEQRTAQMKNAELKAKVSATNNPVDSLAQSVPKFIKKVSSIGAKDNTKLSHTKSAPVGFSRTMSAASTNSNTSSTTTSSSALGGSDHKNRKRGKLGKDSWKDAAGRVGGADGYHFGDVMRSLLHA